MVNAKIAQLVEHDLAKVGVAGSSPVFRSNKFFEILSYLKILNASVAQLVEQLTLNQRVQSSSLCGCTK